jgi:hypothetical protein
MIPKSGNRFSDKIMRVKWKTNFRLWPPATAPKSPAEEIGRL